MLEISGLPGLRLGSVQRCQDAIARFRGRVPGKGTKNGEENGEERERQRKE